MLDSIAMQFAAQQKGPEPTEVIIFEGPEGTLAMAEAAPVEAPQESVRAERTEPAEAAGHGGEALETVLVPYLVGPYDTFARICLQHRMSAQELMQVNALSRPHARPGSTVLVWGQRTQREQQAELRRGIIAQFRRRCRCTTGEARYYLEENAYELEAALRQHAAEVAWESQLPLPASPELRRIVVPSGAVRSAAASDAARKMADGDGQEARAEAWRGKAAAPKQQPTWGRAFTRCVQACMQ